MPLYIKDDSTADLVARLASERGVSKQDAVKLAVDAVKLAVQAELERAQDQMPLRERLSAWHAANPLPPPTGLVADKASFDEPSGEP